MKILLAGLLLVSGAMAETGSDLLIKGKIGSDFNTERVLIKDSLGQTFYLKAKYFPKGFEFKQGKEFVLEVPEEAMEDVKLKK